MALGLAVLLGTFGSAAFAKRVAARSLGPTRGGGCRVGSVQSHLHSRPAAPTG